MDSVTPRASFGSSHVHNQGGLGDARARDELDGIARRGRRPASRPSADVPERSSTPDSRASSVDRRRGTASIPPQAPAISTMHVIIRATVLSCAFTFATAAGGKHSELELSRKDEALREDLAPRLFYAPGCSGSSASGGIAKRILHRLGVKTLGGGGKDKNACNPSSEKYLSGAWETFKAQKNCFEAHNRILKAASKEAIRLTAEAVRKRDAVWFANPPPLDQHTAAVLVEHHSKIVSMSRQNVLDRLICNVRDCFDTKHGQSIDLATGKPSRLCFGRRKSSKTIVAHLYVKSLVKTLKNAMTANERQAGMIRRFGFHTVASTSYEALTAFEYDSANLNQSINAWDYVLRSWGYDTNTSFIEFALRMDPNFLHYPPPVQHRKVIANFPEVQKTILDTHDRKLTGLLRL